MASTQIASIKDIKCADEKTSCEARIEGIGKLVSWPKYFLITVIGIWLSQWLTSL